MRQSMQKIIPADEMLCHQTVETFATVSESDLSWTEKIWASIFKKDGTLQVDCGLGKYQNRNVMDMFAGISRGKEQITVRASRVLDHDPHRLGAGAFTYEVLEPLKSFRFTLVANDVQPIAFDIILTGVMPPFLESKDAQRETVGLRMCSEVLRYHQLCTVSGTITIDGETSEIAEDEWYAVRDHSWGIRMDVGEPPTDVLRPDRLAQNFKLFWSPMYFQRPDSTWYEIHHYIQTVNDEVTYFSGFINESDGRQIPLVGMRDDLKFDPMNRRLLGGTMIFDAGWGKTREIEIEPAGDTGFHLGAGLYFGFKGHRHGVYLGPENEDGERYDDVSTYDNAREIRQLRDCVIRVSEGDSSGYGIFESILVGEHEGYGLTREESFL